MSSHVGTVGVGGFPLKKEATAKKLGGQHSSSTADPNFLFEQDKPWCMPNLLTRVLYNYACKCIVHYVQDLNGAVDTLEWFTLPYYPC
jgi:hypothetical protein